MALVPCGVCGSSIASDATNCPKCGSGDPWKVKAKQKWLIRLFGLIMIVGGLGYLWFVQIPDIREHGLFYNQSQGK